MANATPQKAASKRNTLVISVVEQGSVTFGSLGVFVEQLRFYQLRQFFWRAFFIRIIPHD